MKKLVLVLFFFCPMALMAHPGIGIVIDSKGNIFYTDLERIWKKEPNGKLTVALEGVHTHELAIDRQDNIYGEHTWYNGERLNTWGHYVWKLRPNGSVEKIKQSSPGFLDDFGFMIDSLGNMYWIQRFISSRFMRKSPDGKITEIASGRFTDIRWTYCTPGGTIYFTDLHKLYKLTPDGKFKLLAENLDDMGTQPGKERRHNVYGIWTDERRNVYVAILSGKKVKRISSDGKVETVAHSQGTWMPAGGVFDKQGSLWLLEIDALNKVRIRKVSLRLQSI